jgi:hypothetical protein
MIESFLAILDQDFRGFSQKYLDESFDQFSHKNKTQNIPLKIHQKNQEKIDIKTSFNYLISCYYITVQFQYFQLFETEDSRAEIRKS